MTTSSTSIRLLVPAAVLGAVTALIVTMGGALRNQDQHQEQEGAESMHTTTDRERSAGPAGEAAPKYSQSAYDITPLSRERVEELASKLDPETYRITQRAGTEPAFCGNLLDNKKEGVYVCVVCGLPLFSSDHKFNSGTGWPSFFQPFDEAHVAQKEDRSHGMVRTEINCARCNSHLGHVFEDGPRPTGLRFCLNSASLTFFEKGEEMPAESQPVETETAYFAGGCFWGVEHYFQKGPGVISAESGYMQGQTENPTYKEVCTDTTGHAETVKVVYDPRRITFRRLLEAFFVMHDPTQLNRQGPDVGEQYRSGIYFTSDEQRRDAEAFIKEQTEARAFGGRKIVTEVEEAEMFYPAEEYHQDYVVKTGRPCHIADPW
jgi:peptide methionine sulfoxide reductase msrA/msrB